jgi:hypothetical protein
MPLLDPEQAHCQSLEDLSRISPGIVLRLPDDW